MIPIGDTVQRRNRAWMTWLLIAANAWVFLVQILMGRGQVEAFLGRYALVPASPHARTFVSHMFLHVGLAHLIGNVWFLWLLGDNVEDRMGPFRFLAFYLLCGLAAAGMHVKTYEDSYVPIMGASGAIAGVMGAYCLMFPAARFTTLPPGTYPAFVYLGIWFALQFLRGWQADRQKIVSGVAWWAHVGGFLTGALLFSLFVRRDRWSRRDPGYTD